MEGLKEGKILWEATECRGKTPFQAYYQDTNGGHSE